MRSVSLSDLAIGLDPSSHATVSGHVRRYINYYIASGIGEPVNRTRQFHGSLQNVDVSKLGVGHFDIDKNQEIQEMVIREIRAAI